MNWPGGERIGGGDGDGEGEGVGKEEEEAVDFSSFFFCSSMCTNEAKAGQLPIRYSYVPSIAIVAPFPPLCALRFSSATSTATEEGEDEETSAAAASRGVAEVAATFSGGRE